MNRQLRFHFFVLYLLLFLVGSLALATAFGQRSDYLRLNMVGVPQPSFAELFTGR